MTSPASEIPAPGATHALRVRRVIEETHDSKSFVLDVPPALEATFRYQAGQFLTFSVPVGGATLRRCYSLASAPGVDAEMKFTVKRVAGGRASNWFNDSVRAGDTLQVQMPAGRFVLARGDGPVVLFGGGSGITPLIAIAKVALHTTGRRVKLFYANRDARSIIFRAELDALVKQFPGRLEVLHRLDEEKKSPPQAAELASFPVAGAHHYLCGPGPFMDLVEDALRKAQIAPELIHVERFISPADPAPHADVAAPAGAEVPAAITIDLDGTVHQVPYKPGVSLLQAALDAGLNAPYSCQEGFCGCCSALLQEGKVKMDADDALTPEAKKRGLILACQSRPLTGRCAIKFVEY